MTTGSGFVENWQNGKSLVEFNRHMLTSKHASDVTFRVGKNGDTVQAHRYVLISRSHVFDAMLCGPLAEKDDIRISDVEADVFSEMLMYLYTDSATVAPVNVTGLLYLAKKYAVGGLEKLCLTFLEKNLTPENACLILEHAHRFDEKGIYDKAIKLVLQHANICCASEDFKCLSRDCFVDVMRSDDLIIQPETAFEAALVWAQAEWDRGGREITPPNLRSFLGDIIYRIPFTSMSKEFYVSNVVPRGILTDVEHLKLMSWFLCPERDPSPFIRGKDFVLYNGHKLLTGAQTAKPRVYGRIDFTCSHDVTLHSVCLYGRGGGGGGGDGEIVSCKIGYLELLNREYTLRRSDEMLEEFCIKRYHLDTPMDLNAHQWYYIGVEMEGSPMYVGDGGKKRVNVGQCTVKRYFNLLDWGYVDIIYALEFKRLQS